MNEFVEECRREWKRIGVPEAVANEMAADLAADIAEAEAEGASAEAVVGSGAFDPASFARTWAAERGVAQNASVPRRSWKLPAALALCVAAVIVGLALTLVPTASVQGIAVVAPVPPDAPRAKFVAPDMRSAVHTPGEALMLAGLAGLVLVGAVGLGRRSRA